MQQRGRRIFAGELLVLALGRRNTAAADRDHGVVQGRNAVERNRVKRWMREASRRCVRDLPAVDVVVIARPAVLGAGLAGVRRALRGARDALAAGRGAP